MTGVLYQLSEEILQHFQRWENAQKTNLEGNFSTLPPQTPVPLISKSAKGERLPVEAGGSSMGYTAELLCNSLGSSPILLQWLWEKIPIHGRVCSLHCLEFTSASTSGQPEDRAPCGSSTGSEANTISQLWISPLVVLKVVVRLLTSPASPHSCEVGQAGQVPLWGPSWSGLGSEPCTPVWWCCGGHRRVPTEGTWPVGSQAGFAQLGPVSVPHLWLWLSPPQHSICHS